MIGLQRGSVRLAPYHDVWKELYKKEEQRLRSILKNKAADIQHIGSTSIPGICAKPIIDILVGVSSLAKVPGLVDSLEQNGYIFRKESGAEERLLFVRGTEECRTHHIHFVVWNGSEWTRNIFFRDYLRKHEDAAKAYMGLKEALAQKYPNDRQAYTEGKNDFIRDILNQGGL